MTPAASGIGALAQAVRGGATTARAVVTDALARIVAGNGALNAFSETCPERALAQADRIDAAVARGEVPGPLAGVPFAVKALFDVAGRVTLAGSLIERDSPPACRDADAIAALEAAGAVLVGSTQMDEYAYGFTTENAHTGTTCNPHDPARIAGGSSGGSAAAVAAGMVPLALGTDTNGSVRIPAALCGIHGFKPSFGAVSRRGAFPFVDTLDHVGWFTRDAADLALVNTVLAGSTPVPASEPRVAMLGGWFRQCAVPELAAALDALADALGAPEVELADSDVARSAAYCLTAAAGGSRHLANLVRRPGDFDPATRERLMAGAMLPAAVVARAEAFRAHYRRLAARLFERFDVLIAPTTPCGAPRHDTNTVETASGPVPARASLGLHTQPLSFIGLPVVSAPLAECGPLPLGIQIVAAPGQDATALAMAATLEARGLTARVPLPGGTPGEMPGEIRIEEPA